MHFPLPCWIAQIFSMVMCGIYSANDAEWSYTNPLTGSNHWAENFQTCGLGSQSPINFLDSEITYDQNLKKITIFANSSALQSGVKYTLSNSGHNAIIQFPDDTWYVSFTNNREPHYSVMHMNFHWGGNNFRGSEHSVNGKTYPLEAQLVTYNRLLYPNSSLAESGAEGLAVLGFWAKLSNSSEANDTLFAALGNFEESLADIKAPETEKEIESFDLSKILNQVDSSAYYRYAGSLTIPPCTANVMWTVFKKPAAVTYNQLNKLRTLMYAQTEPSTYMQNNYRPVQPLNNDNFSVRRYVFVSWNHAPRTTKSILLLFSLVFYNMR